MSKRSKRQNKNSIKAVSAVVFVFIIFICVFFRMQTKEIIAQNNDSQQQIDQLQNELAAEKERSEEIDEYSKFVNTKQFIEEMARHRLGLVYPDEIIFKPEEK